ncbi:helix-turn-helix domain-containing protein [Flavobacterium sp. Sd200]|uniref:AraC family transcriptional regulator n=1 Tax=Flavobacterium sp. Sd200 TaxID=2692211 RepID=UPI00136CF4E7|nr:helix-turn-helix domain-containing protein [Flavobacterium sp. Sd200]MXN90250.1 helix-turn-helix domain-containing protein [Flavobacterium sp. Sd200]
MQYKVYNPCPALEKQVRYYWSLESNPDDLPHSRERIFPDGCIELIFNYRELFIKFENGIASHEQYRTMLYGQLKTFIEVEATGSVGLFSVRFNPAGLQPFINRDVGSLTSRELNITELWGDEGVQLEHDMLKCNSNEERVIIIETFLMQKLQTIAFDNSDVEYCVNALTESEGSITIDLLANQLCIGKRQLERKFNAAVGLSPKMLARIIRFQNTLQLIEKKEFTSFTGVAHDGGFYDQAHFIKDFKEFTGLNPKQYFSENLEMVKHFSFDE